MPYLFDVLDKMFHCPVCNEKLIDYKKELICENCNYAVSYIDFGGIMSGETTLDEVKRQFK